MVSGDRWVCANQELVAPFSFCRAGTLAAVFGSEAGHDGGQFVGEGRQIAWPVEADVQLECESREGIVGGLGATA